MSENLRIQGGEAEGKQPSIGRSVPQGIYEIRVQGQLDGEYWTHWFHGMALRSDRPGETVLRGPVPDQAALFGLLDRVRDLGLALVSVHRLEVGNEDQKEAAVNPTGGVRKR